MMSLKGIAKQTLEILEQGEYLSPAGAVVQFAEEQAAAVAGTQLYRPEEALQLLNQQASTGQFVTHIEVTDETSQIAAARLVQQEQRSDVALLNFASAKNPGGGFINGAKAQEEDLARCSGLYPCLLTQPDYYSINRAEDSMLYTDHVIFSPDVPWFRRRSRELADTMFTASVITAPAPNAGQHLRRCPDGNTDIEKVLRQRAGIVLAIAAAQECRHLILGAWGCGVFRNSPAMVADAFAVWLSSDRFVGIFESVLFAVYDPTKERQTYAAFRARFDQ